jgi:phosphoribosyl-AMP cyclohydrolase
VAGERSIEESLQFSPRFDGNGLIPVIAQDASSGQVLMMAYMNRDALQRTIETGWATYYSRSRGRLWKKGEKSGHSQKVEQILVDCDQDSLVLRVYVDAGQCHVGYQSCFYRALNKGSANKLQFIAERVYDPQQTYRGNS